MSPRSLLTRRGNQLLTRQARPFQCRVRLSLVKAHASDLEIATAPWTDSPRQPGKGTGVHADPASCQATGRRPVPELSEAKTHPLAELVMAIVSIPRLPRSRPVPDQADQPGSPGTGQRARPTALARRPGWCGPGMFRTTTTRARMAVTATAVASGISQRPNAGRPGRQPLAGAGRVASGRRSGGMSAACSVLPSAVVASRSRSSVWPIMTPPAAAVAARRCRARPPTSRCRG